MDNLNMESPLKQEKDRFHLKLNTTVYRDDIVKKALSDDADWITVKTSSNQHISLEFKTSRKKDVYDWMNYLIYLHKV